MFFFQSEFFLVVGGGGGGGGLWGIRERLEVERGGVNFYLTEIPNVKKIFFFGGGGGGGRGGLGVATGEMAGGGA